MTVTVETTDYNKVGGIKPKCAYTGFVWSGKEKNYIPIIHGNDLNELVSFFEEINGSDDLIYEVIGW